MNNRPINIVTSCDDRPILRLCIALQSISESQKDTDINFWLMHSRVSRENLALLQEFCAHTENITFHDVYVDNHAEFERLRTYGCDWGWVAEAYYPLMAHRILPDSVSRAMYIDAGDVIFDGDISAFYDADFAGKSLLVTVAFHKSVLSADGSVTTGLFTGADIQDDGFVSAVLQGIFNSGSYLMNLEKMRGGIVDMAYWHGLVEELVTRYQKGALAPQLPGTKVLYFGDQALLSYAYIDDCAFFAYNGIIHNQSMPYNYLIWGYRKMRMPDYKPRVIHYCGNEPKPWEVRFDKVLPRFQDKGYQREELNRLTEFESWRAEIYKVWYKYAARADERLSKIR